MIPRRYIVLLASLLLQGCLGGVYAWSTFTPQLMDMYNISPSQTQIIFGATIATFTIVMLFAGPFQNKYGPRITVLISGVFFGIGYLYASLSRGQFVHIFAGIGLLSGIGIGLGYVCPLATCIKWFPKNKGFVTGVSVASFGTGAIVLSLIAEIFLEKGVGVLVIFRWVGFVYAALILISGLLMAVPQPISTTSQKKAYGKIHKSISFWLLFAGMFSGTFAGLLIIGNLKPIGLNVGLEPFFATLAISTFAIGNGLGRVFWGWALDKAGKIILPLCLVVLALSISALFFAGIYHAVFIATSLLIGLGFGGCFVIYAAYVGISYGSEAVAFVYPWVFLAYGISGILGPTAGGFFYEKTGSYYPPIAVAVTVALAGAVITAFMPAHAEVHIEKTSET